MLQSRVGLPKKQKQSSIKQLIQSYLRHPGSEVREEGQRLSLERTRNLCKDSTLYLLYFKAVASDLLHSKQRFSVLKLRLDPAGALCATLEFFKTGTDGRTTKTQLARSGEIERWVFPGYAGMREDEKIQCVDSLGAYIGRNAYNIELYSDIFEIAEYKSGVIRTSQLPMPGKPPQLNDNILLPHLQHYEVYIKERSVEIVSQAEFIPYVVSTQPTTTFEQYCPEYQWRFTRRGNTFEVLYYPCQNNGGSFIPGFRRMQADWKKPIISSSLTSMLQFLGKFSSSNARSVSRVVVKDKRKLVCRQNSVSPFNFNISFHKVGFHIDRSWIEGTQLAIQDSSRGCEDKVWSERVQICAFDGDRTVYKPLLPAEDLHHAAAATVSRVRPAQPSGDHRPRGAGHGRIGLPPQGHDNVPQRIPDGAIHGLPELSCARLQSCRNRVRSHLPPSPRSSHSYKHQTVWYSILVENIPE